MRTVVIMSRFTCCSWIWKRHQQFLIGVIIASFLLDALIIFILGVSGKLKSPVSEDRDRELVNNALRRRGGIISTNENRRKDNYKFPKVIWQTAKSHNPPPAVAKIMFSWKDKNPGWDQRLLDDDEVDAFMVQHFNESVVAAFRKLPVPVMRADFFRLAVVYHLGGIYADVDVECSVPIHDWWFDGAVHKCEVVVGMENDIHVSNWGFASVKHHLLFQQATDVSLSRFVEHGVNTSWEHFVHATTGPGVLTTALADLARAAGCKWNELPGAIREIYESCRVTLKEEYNICFVNEITQRKWFHNHYASQKIELQGEDFVGDWTKTAKEVFKEASLNQSQ